jgi:hypothetical protein
VGLHSPTVLLRGTGNAKEIHDYAQYLRHFGVCIPEFNVITSTVEKPEGGEVKVLIFKPNHSADDGYFSPSYLRVPKDRDLHEAEFQTISTVTQALTREILKLLDVPEGGGEVPLIFSGKFSDYLVSIPRENPETQEIGSDAIYLGFAHVPPRLRVSNEEQLTGETSSPKVPQVVTNALVELFIDAICTLYQKTGDMPTRWGEILTSLGISAVVEGMMTACNESKLLQYSAFVCSLTSDRIVLRNLQAEFNKRWIAARSTDS